MLLAEVILHLIKTIGDVTAATSMRPHQAMKVHPAVHPLMALQQGRCRAHDAAFRTGMLTRRVLIL
jgi:hypothetical protein